MLIALVLLGIFSVSTIIIISFELYQSREDIEYLEERVLKLDLTVSKLEKDAVKITFTTDDDKVVIHPEVKNKPDNPYWKKPGTKTTPKVMGEWQTKNKNKPLIEGRVKSTSKGDTGTTQGPPPLPARKPKNYNK